MSKGLLQKQGQFAPHLLVNGVEVQEHGKLLCVHVCTSNGCAADLKCRPQKIQMIVFDH